MDTIREYLNNLFLGFPETPAVIRAKAELLEMMEDKYDECIKEGKSEKEAVGTVISEFGNIEEIAEELGIEEDLRRSKEEKGKGDEQEKKADFQPHVTNDIVETQDKKGAHEEDFGEKTGRTPQTWKLDQAKEYLSYAWKHAWMVAAGVACFIFSVFLNSAIDDIGRDSFINSEAIDFFCDLIFLVGVIAGILICSQAKRLKKTCPVLIRGNVLQTDEETGLFMQQQREKDEKKIYRMRLLGVVLLILGFFPPAVAGLIHISWISSLLDNTFLLFAGFGVMLFITAGSVENRYKEFARTAYFDEDYIGFDGSTGSGGKVFEGYRKKKGNSVLVGFLVGIVLLLVLGVFVAGIAYLSFRKTSDTQEVQTTKSYDADAIKEIRIDLDTEDLLIESGDVEHVELSYTGKQNIRPDLKSDGSLVVETKGRHSFFAFDFSWLRSQGGLLKITVPNEFVNMSGIYQRTAADISNMTKDKRKITAELDTGNIKIRNLAGTDFDLSTDTGNISLKEIMGRKFELDADTGDIELARVLGTSLTADDDVGNISVNESFFPMMDCDLDTGSFYMELPLTREEFCNIFQADFSIELDRQLRFFGEDISEKEAAGLCKGSRSVIKVSTDVGGIEVKDEENQG